MGRYEKVLMRCSNLIGERELGILITLHDNHFIMYDLAVETTFFPFIFR